MLLQLLLGIIVGSGSHFFTSSILPRDSAPVFDRDLPCAGSEQNLTDCFSGCLNNSCGLTGLCCNISDSDSVQEAQCTVMGVVVNCAGTYMKLEAEFQKL